MKVPEVRLIVVANQCSVAVEGYLTELACASENVSVELLAENRGSAGGYKTVIRNFLERTSCERLLLLDDDNELILDDVSVLSQSEVQAASAIFRPHRRIMRQIVAGYNPDILYPPQGSFLGFDVLYLVRKFFHLRFFQPNLPRSGLKEAPYSGLIIRRSVIDAVGYPSEKFFLYADDTDYTRRIVKRFGLIKIVSDASINELEQSWNSGLGSNSLLSRLRASDKSFRIYYSIRNRVNLDMNEAGKAGFPYFRYRINKAIYLSIFRVFLRAGLFSYILKAVFDGERERLGVEVNEKI
ncbi:glycosyltransferase family 2 protein [Cupriavidus basilensis]|uniref:glycosyltransferase family 2 protein n=1 Tax=Cupriavidus basilensis TaxID=68895 RepID=UPI00157A449B|nr:glycosyltransferase [Cupriavidus basilensis]